MVVFAVQVAVCGAGVIPPKLESRLPSKSSSVNKRHWRASEASETLSGVYKFELVRYVYIYIYIYICMEVLMS